MRFASNKLECSKQALSLNILAWYDENDSSYIETILSQNPCWKGLTILSLYAFYLIFNRGMRIRINLRIVLKIIQLSGNR
jgi:hypothetical protein